MADVVSVSEAKAQLSKLVKMAQAGETIYVGSHGNPQAVIAPVPVRKPIPIGVSAHKRRPDAYEDDDLVRPDEGVTKDFELSIAGSDSGTELP